MDDIGAGLLLLLQWQSLISLLLGVIAGFVVGVLPGFSSANAAAVLLPFTLVFQTEIALIFLMGIYAGSCFASGVPAILLNIPGTGSAAATALDGYPMAQKGLVDRAIGIARTASAIGGVVGVIITVALLVPLSQLAFQFGTTEMFVVALIGLTVIASVMEGSVIKGAIAAVFGVVISTMSADSMRGQSRFDMGFIELYDQVPFIPALIGLFAITQMLEAVRQERVATDHLNKRTTLVEQFAEFKEGIKVTWSYKGGAIRGGVIGALVGIIPGAGTSVGTFVSYGQARLRSKEPWEFGKGAPEGIIAAESAENGVTAGTLVPTLALGIPGGATAAVVLAAFYLNGIVPGPQLMENYGAEAYAIILSLLLASLLIIPLGALLAAPMVRILQVPVSILVPIVLLLALVGAFAVRGFVFDVALALAFGALGLLMKSKGYPVVPMVLGIILGPLAEANFVRALQLGSYTPGYFFSFERPLTLVLWFFFAIIVIYNIVAAQRSRTRDRERSSAPSGKNAPDDKA